MQGGEDGEDHPFWGPRRTARTDDALADAPDRTFASRGYGGVALVAVGMTAKYDVGTPLVEHGPEAPHLGAIVAYASSPIYRQLLA